MQTIFPILRYNNARAAIRWLCAASGFVEVFRASEQGAFVRHARLRLVVSIEDPDAHYERALGAGAKILYSPKDTDFGSREANQLRSCKEERLN